MAVSTAATVRVLIRHPVADYDAWRSLHDARGEERRGMGAIAEAVYQSLDDPTDITVATDFATAHAARAFAAAARQRGRGIIGSPEVWLVSER